MATDMWLILDLRYPTILSECSMGHIKCTLGLPQMICLAVAHIMRLVNDGVFILHNRNFSIILSVLLKHFLKFETLRVFKLSLWILLLV